MGDAAGRVTLDELNAMPAAAFAAALEGVFEDAPWVAGAVAGGRPFATVAALHEAMMAAVLGAPEGAVLGFLRGHPELSGAAARAGAIGAASQAEQAGLGLQRAVAATDAVAAMNAAYQARFGFPFIVCVRRHTAASLTRVFRRRLEGEAAAERAAALAEIGFITRLRLTERVEGPGAPAVHGWLSTHVLDTARGRPAAGVAVELFEVGGAHPVPVASAVTNGDGRTDAPLIAGQPLRMGVYELRFGVGAYFGAASVGEPAFLDVVPVRFGISEPEAHYHVPLLASPGGYSTYRGS